MSKIEAPEIIIVDYNGIKIDAYNRPDADRYIDTLTSELEAERKAKEEAIEILELLSTDISSALKHKKVPMEYYSNREFYSYKCDLLKPIKECCDNFLKTHTPSKGEK